MRSMWLGYVHGHELSSGCPPQTRLGRWLHIRSKALSRTALRQRHSRENGNPVAASSLRTNPRILATDPTDAERQRLPSHRRADGTRRRLVYVHGHELCFGWPPQTRLGRWLHVGSKALSRTALRQCHSRENGNPVVPFSLQMIIVYRSQTPVCARISSYVTYRCVWRCHLKRQDSSRLRRIGFVSSILGVSCKDL
jgi:hypothetical protein